MLAEVIVTSTIVVTTMILLYTTFNRLYNNYKTKNTYFNLDATYATKEMIDELLETRYINTFIANNISGSQYANIIDSNGECNSTFMPLSPGMGNQAVYDTCTSIKDLYDIKTMILVEYDEGSFDILKQDITLNQTFADYIEYLKKYNNIDETKEEYTYIVLTETKVNGKNYYGSLRIR